MPKCEEVMRKLSDYLSANLASGEARGIHRHMQHCRSCPRVFRAGRGHYGILVLQEKLALRHRLPAR